MKGRACDGGSVARAARRAPVLAVTALLCGHALAAQTRWVTALSIGTSPRLGAVPGSLDPRGTNWGANVYAGFRTARSTFVTANLGMTTQRFAVRDSTGAIAETRTFHSYVFGAGPTVVARPGYGLFGLVSLQPAVVVSFWGSSRMTDTRAAAAFSAQLGYQFAGRGSGRRPYGVALELKGLAAPDHARSGLPVSHAGLYLSFVAGEP